ncbi:MAG: hypothetical protein KME26_29115, partial [Oscillatoria princeps RMCB-10]|nr:hypothetical protein [Oscillatoria princeps RMCB-10]
MPMFMKKPVVKIDTLRLTVAGITLGFPLEPRRPSVNRGAQQPAPPQRMMRETPAFDAFPNASRFDGVSDKLDMPYAPELNPGSFTVEMWAMVQGGTGYQSVLSSVAGSPLEGRKGYLLCLTPSRQWQFWTGSGEPKAFWRVLRGPVAVPDVWTHLAGTYDRQSRTVTFYVSGQEVGRQSGVHYQPNDRNPTRVGAGATEQWGASPCFFCGKVAEVHIWDRVLAPVEIQALASQQSIDVQAEPVAEMGSEGQDGESGTGSTTAQRSPAPDTPPPDMFGQSASAWPAVSPGAWGGGDQSPLSRSPVAEQPLAWLEQATASSVPDPQSALWQIGSPGQGGMPAPTGAWVPVYNYTIGTDPDPVNRPTIPSCLVPATASTIPNSTSQLNIHFVLPEDYTEGQLVLCYDRYGSGEDSIFLDGERIASTPGADRGKLKQSQIPLGFAAKGPHTISITTSNSGDSAHVIDYLQLKTVKPMLSNLTSQVLPSGNQSQSGSGSEGGQNARSQGGQDAGGMLGGLLSPATGLLGQATGALGGATGALGQVAGAAGGAGQLLGQATGMLGGLTGQGGGQGGAGGLLGSLPGVGGLLGGGGQGGGGGGLLGGLPLVGGVLDQVGGIAGGLPGVGGLLGQVGGIAGGLPGVGGALGGLPGVGGILGQGGGAGGMGGQVMPGTQSAQVVLQLAQLVAQINALLAQVTQLLNVLAGAGQVAGGGIPGLGGGIPGLGGGIPGLGGGIPGLGGGIPGLGGGIPGLGGGIPGL